MFFAFGSLASGSLLRLEGADLLQELVRDLLLQREARAFGPDRRIDRVAEDSDHLAPPAQVVGELAPERVGEPADEGRHHQRILVEEVRPHREAHAVAQAAAPDQDPGEDEQVEEGAVVRHEQERRARGNLVEPLRAVYLKAAPDEDPEEWK